MNLACGFDMGDCDDSGHGGYGGYYHVYYGYGGNCAPGCLPGWPGDGICDSTCMNEACGFDMGDCDDSSAPPPAPPVPRRRRRRSQGSSLAPPGFSGFSKESG